MRLHPDAPAAAARADCAPTPSIASSTTRCARTSSSSVEETHRARACRRDAARDAARREFGPVTQTRRGVRATRAASRWLSQRSRRTCSYGVRLMRRAPGFAAAAILTVALGIGATTAMFSVVYGVVLQPLPYRDPDRLVNLWTDRAEARAAARLRRHGQRLRLARRATTSSRTSRRCAPSPTSTSPGRASPSG